jgi:hypothetical protein
VQTLERNGKCAVKENKKKEEDLDKRNARE